MKVVLVAAAIIERDGRFLVTRRQPGTHLAGTWEFPGGKCEDGEGLTACLERELHEELGIRARVGTEVFSTRHEYPGRHVQLHFFACESADEPVARLGQEMQWVAREALGALEFPPADAQLIDILKTRRAD
jgi:8-oxo-dGTP diphosphatase